MEKGHLTQLRKAMAGSRTVSRVFQVDREMRECSRQRDDHVQRHRGGWKQGVFKGITVSSIRKDSGKQGGQGNSGREIWLGPIIREYKN